MARTWKLAPALEQLRKQINEQWPDRSKASDGTIGDAAHASRKSDHNPNRAGVVCAMDITRDSENGPDCEQLALALLRDERTNYVIYNKRIASRGDTWRKYKGHPHTQHVHISVRQNPEYYNDDSEWALEASEFSSVGFYQEPTKPLISSTEARGAAVGVLAAIAGLLQKPEFWGAIAFVAVIATCCYIVWRRYGKPDIAGWIKRKVF